MKKTITLLLFLAVSCLAEDFYQEFNPLGQHFRFEQGFRTDVVDGGTSITYTNMYRYPWKLGSYFSDKSSSVSYTVTLYHVDISYSNQFSGDVVLTNAMSEVITNNYWVVTNQLAIGVTNVLYSGTYSNQAVVLDDDDIKRVYFTTGDKLVIHHTHIGSTATQVDMKIQATE